MSAELEDIHEECGIFGVWGHSDAARLTYFGLHALQHRGQEGAGIVSNDNGHLIGHRGTGLLTQVFSDEREIERLKGDKAIGHVRYATAGSGGTDNIQPFIFRFHDGDVALCHNGNLVNARELREELELGGAIFHTTSDTEVISYLITRERLKCDSIEEAVSRAIRFADAMHCPMCIVHVSCIEAGEEIRKARAEGKAVIGETCPHYLVLDKHKMDHPDWHIAARWICSPALRDKEDQDYLWKALNKDWLSICGSDNSGIPQAQKNWGWDEEHQRCDFRMVPNGCPGAGDRMNALWTYGVAAGRMTRQKFVDVCCTTPAKLNGIYPRKGTIQVGEIQSFIQYVKNFTQPITQIAQISNMLQSMAAAAERVFEFLNEEEEDQTCVSPARVDDLKGAVEFDHVNFGYTPDKTVIRDFSARVEPGQMVAIVGPTGAGKTTMVKLLMRFYDVNAGAIRVDGHDVRDFNRSELREAFGMVLQDTWLFKGTILENIRYGRLDATDAEVVAAAKAAHVHHFIMTLPGGYQMELNEDATNISQGQKQLLTIARAILADNKILILDEATSSVDTRTEHLIQRAMGNLMQGRTSFVIAHRLSTIKDADLILVMKDGDIVEQGSHEALLARGGFYAELYNSQFEDAAG